MIRYQVRSKELIDLVNEIKSNRLIMSPYFQRNLVWRDIHKVDFIKTILMGLPFPQIFIAKGSIDLETMTTTSCIVDGQQRMSTIVDFVSSRLSVEGRLFKDLDPTIKEEVLKYQIPIIDLDITNEAPEIKEIFQRLNRTFYSLNTIERLSSEFASSEFMLYAKHLAGELVFQSEYDEDNQLLIDPTIPRDFIEWANEHDVIYFKMLMLEKHIFTPYEISRQIHLMYVLNLLATQIGGYYARNELVTRYLEEFKESVNDKLHLLGLFESTAKFILDLDLPDRSYWLNKANMFTLFTFLSRTSELLRDENISGIRDRLLSFEASTPSDYQLAAKEAVNNRQQRLLRNTYLENLLL